MGDKVGVEERRNKCKKKKKIIETRNHTSKETLTYMMVAHLCVWKMWWIFSSFTP